MESKYYTPTIEEFHIGFECEWRRFEEDWHGGIINSSIELYDAAIEYEAGENQTYEYRVKYLDKEDIEELGFEESLDEPDEWFWKFKGNIGIQLYFDDKYRNKDQGIGITIYDDEVIFSGYIKNKSELKTLLKQLGIE